MAQRAFIDGNLITDNRPLAVEQQGIVTIQGAVTVPQNLGDTSMFKEMLVELRKIRIHLETITGQEVKEIDL